MQERDQKVRERRCARERQAGARAYAAGLPLARYKCSNWRLGWLGAQRDARRPFVVVFTPPAIHVPPVGIDIGRLEMMRRGAGNRSGTGGKKGRL